MDIVVGYQPYKSVSEKAKKRQTEMEERQKVKYVNLEQIARFVPFLKAHFSDVILQFLFQNQHELAMNATGYRWVSIRVVKRIDAETQTDLLVFSIVIWCQINHCSSVELVLRPEILGVDEYYEFGLQGTKLLGLMD